jgi:hypothetical protein
VQQRTCSRDTGSVTAKLAAAEDDDDGESSSTSCNALLDTLSDDIYSYTVKCAVQGVRGCTMLKAVLAMLFTFALQMGLLVLLWQAVVTGSATEISTETPETHRLWRQVGQVQRQVCWLNKNAVINTTAAADGTLNCEGAWPHGPFCRAGGRKPPSMGYKDMERCLHTLFSRPPNFLWLLFGNWLDDKTRTKLIAKQESEFPVSQQACEGLRDLGSSDKAFGMGLLFPNYMPLGMMHENLTNAYWHDGTAPGAPNSFSDITQEFFHLSFSHEGCIPEIPHDPGQEPSVVNVLAFLALAVYVHHETMQALWLGYVSAACCSILPPFCLTRLSTGVACHRFSACRVVLMLCAPVLQQATGIAVLVSSMGLTFIRETQASVVAIVLSNVALSFILDLDNRVGCMLHTQAMHNTRSSPPPVERARAVKQLACWSCVDTQSSACSRVCGHLYLALLGLLLLAEPLCLAPAPAVQIWSSRLRCRHGQTMHHMESTCSALVTILSSPTQIHGRGRGLNWSTC